MTPIISSQSCVIGWGREGQYSFSQEKPLCLKAEVSWDNWAGSRTAQGSSLGGLDREMSTIETGFLQFHYVPRGRKMQKTVGKASRQAVFILNLHSLSLLKELRMYHLKVQQAVLLIISSYKSHRELYL